jgi:hypothetical protein
MKCQLKAYIYVVLEHIQAEESVERVEEMQHIQFWKKDKFK